MKGLVLIIEDDEILQSLLLSLLEKERFAVLSAEDGCCGLQLAQEFHPDVIICDINLPKLNGFEVLKRLRSSLTTAKVPFIFYTSNSDSECLHRAMQLGANEYLIKPTSIKQLLESINNQIQLTRLESQEVIV
ncbi:MAG: hypothetical protein Fur006_57750 [Coleofasciculaceae cyanobacterium]